MKYACGARRRRDAGAGRPQREARDQIRIVGSSTVFPFSTAVAEQFGKTAGFKTPVVEIDRHRRRLQAVLRRRRRRPPGHHQRLARGSRTREIEACAKQRRDRDHRGQDRLRRHRARQLARPRPRFALTQQADLAGAGQGGAGRRQAGRQPLQELERDRRRRCRPRRSRCWARRRPPARATPSSSWSWTRAARNSRRSRRSKPTPRRPPARRSARTAPTSRPARTTT